MSMNAIQQTYEFLKSVNAIDSQKDFCEQWLHRNESYFRSLKFHNTEPSIEVIAVFAYKLKHYGSLLKRQNNATKRQIGETLLTLHADCERCIHERCKRVWLTEMGSAE